MSAEELRQYQAQIARSFGIHNINCGCLRRIGKTLCLKSIIAVTPPPVFLFVPTREMAEEYRDMQIERIIQIRLPVAYSTHQELVNITHGVRVPINAFSDEIPGFESIIRQNRHYNYVAGFYSTNLREDALTRHMPPQIPRFNLGSDSLDMDRIQEDLNQPARIVTAPAPTFFEMSWVSDPSKIKVPLATPIKDNKSKKPVQKLKMKFIVEED